MKKERRILKNGKLQYILQYTENGKRKRRFFNHINDYRTAKRALRLIEDSEISTFIEDLTREKVIDFINATNILPKNKTLLDCVKLACKVNPKEITIDEAMEEFIKIKKDKVSEKQYLNTKYRLNKIKNYIPTFEDVSASKILSYCKENNLAPKTTNHYLGILRDFFNYCEIKKYFLNNPFNEIHSSEVPKIERKSLVIPKVENMKAFFKACEMKHPKLVGLLALVAFGGLRTSEAQKIELENINFKEKSILISFKDSKTGNTWLQTNMPANVWTWLDRYKPCIEWKNKRYTEVIKKLKDSFDIGENAFRHSFATYHLSLLREAPKTSILMRHTNPSQLWQTYLEGLTSEEVAKAYFAIIPKEDKQEAESSLNLPVTSEPLGSL